MKKHFVVVLAIVLMACSSSPRGEEEKLELECADSLVFSTQFSFQDRPSGRFYHQERQEWCYYFGNLSTNKSIKIFSNKGKDLYQVQLDTVLSKSRISEVEVWSPDTIWALSQYNGQLYAINRKGQVWKSIDLLGFLPQDSVWGYELGSSYFSKLNFSRNAILLALNPIVRHKTKGEFSSAYSIQGAWSKDQFVRFGNIFSDQIEVQTGFPMYKEIAPHDSTLINVEVKSFEFSSQAMYAHSYYSDRVFVLDPTSLAYLKSYQLKSKYKTLPTDRASTKGKTNAEILSDLRALSGGMVARHFYNEFLQHHYFVISIDRESWSLLLYDHHFKKIGEKRFFDKAYTPFVLPSERGFYLQKTNEKVVAYHQQKLSFHEFTY